MDIWTETAPPTYPQLSAGTLKNRLENLIEFTEKNLHYLSIGQGAKEFLKKMADDIGGHLVHLTSKATPKLKSQQEWPFQQISECLVPALMDFCTKIPVDRFLEISKECTNHLLKVNPPEMPPSVTAST